MKEIIYCPICGEANKKNEEKCTSCKQMLTEEDNPKKESKSLDVFCNNCGEKLTNDASFCKECGTKIEKKAKTKNSSRIGWSEKVHDPSFAKYNKNEVRWKLIFGLTLTVVAFLGFNIFGPQNGMEKNEAMIVGSVIGGMFFLITIVSVIRSKSKKTFSGVIVDKTCITKKKKYDDMDGISRTKEYDEYTVYYQDDITGKKKILTREEDSTFKYDYFKVGEKIKYHAIGNNGIEKYDKSEDEISYCLACNYLNDIENDKCEMCGCPIIK